MGNLLDELFADSTSYDTSFDITKSYKDNPNWIKFSKEQFIQTIAMDKGNLNDATNQFKYNSELSLEDEKYYVYFKKTFYEDDQLKIYEGKSEDLLYMKLDGQDHIFSVYQIESVYRRKNVITITGWDYNMVVDLDDNSIEREDTR